MDYIEIGKELKERRRASGKSIEEVSADIQVDTRKLKALEEGDYSFFEDINFFQLFYRTYARYLGILKDAESQPFQEDEEEELEFSKHPRRPGLKHYLIAVSLTFLLLFIGYRSYISLIGIDNGEPKVIAPTQPPEDEKPINEPPVDIEPVKPPLEKIVIVQIEVIKDRCWVQVNVDEEEIPALRKILTPGEKYEFKGKKEVRLWVGNAGVLNVLVDGILQPSLGTEGEVRRDVVYHPISR